MSVKPNDNLARALEKLKMDSDNLGRRIAAIQVEVSKSMDKLKMAKVLKKIKTIKNNN